MAEYERNELTFDDELFMLYSASSSSQTPKTPSIWHYTDTNGLKGIVNPKGELKFRFTESKYLNDMSEGQDICVAFKDACNEALDKNIITDDFLNLIINSKPLEYDIHVNKEDNKIEFNKFKSFICCFSFSPDLLDMWRYYSKGSPGYSLGINAAIIDKIAASYNGKVRFHRVVYDSGEKNCILIEVIRNIYEVYERYKGHLPEDYVERIRNYISYCLREYQLVFKHSCFKNEEEYRIVIPILFDSNNENDIIQYRESKYGLVPYIEIEIPHSSDYLNLVYISPFQEKLSIDSTKSFLMSRGFTSDVVHSALPVRF